jgi:hypothetical protein
MCGGGQRNIGQIIKYNRLYIKPTLLDDAILNFPSEEKVKNVGTNWIAGVMGMVIEIPTHSVQQ